LDVLAWRAGTVVFEQGLADPEAFTAQTYEIHIPDHDVAAMFAILHADVEFVLDEIQVFGGYQGDLADIPVLRPEACPFAVPIARDSTTFHGLYLIHPLHRRAALCCYENFLDYPSHLQLLSKVQTSTLKE